MRKTRTVCYDVPAGKIWFETKYYIYAERDGGSMGDECCPLHGKSIDIEKNDKLSDFFNKLIKEFLSCIPGNRRWTITEGDKILGYVIFSENEGPRYELEVPDDYLLDLDIESVYCS